MKRLRKRTAPTFADDACTLTRPVVSTVRGQPEVFSFFFSSVGRHPDFTAPFSIVDDRIHDFHEWGFMPENPGGIRERNGREKPDLSEVEGVPRPCGKTPPEVRVKTPMKRHDLEYLTLRYIMAIPTPGGTED